MVSECVSSNTSAPETLITYLGFLVFAPLTTLYTGKCLFLENFINTGTCSAESVIVPSDDSDPSSH